MTVIETSLRKARDADTVRPGKAAVHVSGLAPWLLAGYVFLIPVQIAVGDSLRFAPSDLFVLGYIALRFPVLTVRRSTLLSWHAVFGVSLLVGMTVAALHDQLTLYAVLNKGVGAVVLFAAYLSIIDFCTDLPLVFWLTRAFLWGVLLNVLVALAALYAYNAGVANLTFINFSGVRLAGFLVDPNAFGGLLVAAIALHFLPRVAGAPVLTGRAGQLMSLVLPIGLVMTYSRSAWIGGVAAILVGAWRLGYRFLRPLLLFTAGIGVLAVVGAALVFPNAGNLIDRPEQVDGRVTILQNAFNDFSTSPVTGIGLGASIERNNIQIHNTTAFFITELGPLGAVALFGILVAYAMRADRLSRSRDRRRQALGVGLLAAHIGVYGVSMGIDAFYQRYWWMTFALIAALTTHDADRSDRHTATASSLLLSRDPHKVVKP